MACLLELASVHAAYGRNRVLHGINVRVDEHGITALLGANGAGKTTTLRAISGLVRASGTLNFAGRSILNHRADRIARQGIAHVPDGRGTLTHLTVAENLEIGGYRLSNRSVLQLETERMCGYFPILAKRYRQPAGTLSGGEQQMLAIARALMMRPRLLLLDEPSFGVAPLVIREVFSIIRLINAEEKVGILLVEQNAAQALDVADHAYVLEMGRIILAGSAADVKADPAVQRAYLGS